MIDYTIGKEREYQNAVVDMFKKTDGLGYDYLGNLQYTKGETSRNGGIHNSNVIESELRAFLDAMDYTPLQVNAAVKKLLDAANLPCRKFSDLLERNATFYELLVSGTKAKPSPENTEEDVMFIDFKHPLNNRFSFAEEVSYIDPITGKHSRPDIVVFVNGIALAVIELKKASVTITEGIKQCLSNEKDLIPSFFTTVQFTIAANPKHDNDKMKIRGLNMPR